MSKTKKRFGLPSNVSRGMSEVMQIQEGHASVYRNTIIPIKRILIDPDNPRKHAVTLVDIENGLDKTDPLYDKKRDEYDGLKELSDSIRSEGLIHPVVVYQENDNYRLVAGERRYFASLLAGHTSIEARAFQRKPKGYGLKLVQWLENESRKNLSLANRLSNVKNLIHAYQQEFGDEPLTAQLLASILKIGQPTAIHFLRILKNERLYQLIQDGVVTKQRDARTLASVKDKDRFESFIAMLKRGESTALTIQTLDRETEKKVRAPIEKHKKSGNSSPRPGRIRNKVSFGATKNPEVAKFIIECVLKSEQLNELQESFKSVNWTNLDESTKAFEKIVSVLERKWGK